MWQALELLVRMVDLMATILNFRYLKKMKSHYIAGMHKIRLVGLPAKQKKLVYLTCFFCNKHHLRVYKLYVLALEHGARCLIPHIVIKLYTNA